MAGLRAGHPQMKPLSGALNAKDVQEETAPAIHRSIPTSAGSSMLLKDLRFC
jgi:hypothetical protein